VAWTSRYLPGRALPDKAIQVLDLAGARARRRGLCEVTAEQVAEVVSEQASVPLERLMQTDSERMMRLEELLQDRVVGHAGPLGRMARIIRRNTAGLNAGRPIGTFLLLGPTGVGKTETAKALAAELFDTETAMTRLDLSEFSEAHSVARLIGAPPGYVGHESGGQLTEAVRRRPYQVLLLDEIEKAHPEVLETFLAVFDEGRLTDGRGRTVDFTNTIILLTSNLGSREAQSRPSARVGFGSSRASAGGDVEERFIRAAKAGLTPELYNRIDEVLVYEPLTRAGVFDIATRLLVKLGRSVVDTHQIDLSWEAAAVEVLLEQGGFEPELGARPMKRAIARLVEAPLAELLLSGEVRGGDRLVIREARGAIELEAHRPALEPAAE
jgi:ATP-dependent Clp protease ATP-binding subunit ClpC